MDVEIILKELASKLPTFADGRIDYTNSDKAVVLTCFVEYEGKILLLKRSDKVGTYKYMWTSVTGYIDEFVPIKQKVLEELKEELHIFADDIKEMHGGKAYEFYDNDIKKTWIICPFLVTLKKFIEIKLDWEHTEYKWIDPSEMKNFDIVPNLDKSLDFVLAQQTK